ARQGGTGRRAGPRKGDPRGAERGADPRGRGEVGGPGRGAGRWGARPAVSRRAPERRSGRARRVRAALDGLAEDRLLAAERGPCAHGKLPCSGSGIAHDRPERRVARLPRRSPPPPHRPARTHRPPPPPPPPPEPPAQPPPPPP